MRRIAKVFPRPSLGATSVSLLVALYIVLADNHFFWHSFIGAIGLETRESRVFLFSMGLAFVLLLNIPLSLFSFRPVFKPLLILLLLTTAAISYFSDNFGVVVDRPMVHSILETDIGEASELLSWPLFRHLLLFGGIPAALVVLTRIRYRSRKRELLFRVGVVLGTLAVLLILGLGNYKQFVLFGRENRDLRILLNPTYPLYSLGKVIKEKYLAHAAEPLRAVATDAVRAHSGPPSVLVLVIGETARAREFAFNGYDRDTNPQLATREVIDFPAVQACGTATSESLPCIFSSLARRDFNREKASQQENLLDILQRLGVSVLWRDNNSGSKGVAERVEYEDLSKQTDASLCVDGNCFDEILLRDLYKRLAEAAGDMLIVLHMKGSHGPSYYKRTPAAFKVFSPECALDDIQNCSRDSIVNAYDNTILYTDHVLSRLIDLLKAQNSAAAMLYVSDHGESLGEDGLYLHGLPFVLAPGEQKQVPMIFWASEEFIRGKSINVAALEARRRTPYSHDFIFHSVLGLFDVHSETYRPELDIFAGTVGMSSSDASEVHSASQEI